MRIRWQAAVLAAVWMACAGCALFFATKTPMDVEWHRVREGQRARTLLVMLPGRGDSPAGYVAAGFPDEARASGLDVDLALVDAHLGYYYHRNLIERLHEDVIQPAREAGYESIWLCGISMGGLGAILYAEKHAEDIDGMFLMAPFLGYEEVEEEVYGAGGAMAWQPPDPLDPEDWERGVWVWLKGLGAGEPRPVMVLGYARGDEFRRANRMLADLLPPERVYEVDGGHDWGPWQKMFRTFLSSGNVK